MSAGPARSRAGRAIAAFTALALATTPVLAQTGGVNATPLPATSAAPATPAAPAPGGVYGSVPPSPPPVPANRASTLPDLGDSAQAVMSPAQSG